MIGSGPLKSVYASLPAPLRALTRSAFRRVPFPYRRGVSFARHYNGFLKTERLDAEALGALQLAALREVAAHAYATVPAYRERFDAIGMKPHDVRALGDWAALPLTRKAELQDDLEAFVSDRVAPAARLVRTTSGSTGTPLRIVTTAATQVAEAAIMYRGWRWSGYRDGDRIATCVGELTGEITGPAHAPVMRGRDSLELCPDHLDERGARSYAEMLAEFDPHYVRMYPSILQILGKHLAERGLRMKSLRGLWTQSEIVYPDERQLLEELWGARIFDYYGMQEKCVAMSECERGRMHMHSEFGLVELVPTKKPPYHHIVATGFYNRAMPLLRYATRDLAVPHAEPCPCGRAHPTVARIVGRVEDFLLAADGRQVMEADATIGDQQGIRECQIVQHTLTHVEVFVVPAPSFDAAAERSLVASLQAQLGEGVRIEVQHRDRIPRTATGKQRFIVSKVKSGWKL